MTPYDKVYEAFLARILEDEWENWLIEEAQADWKQIMEAAIPWFKFPRISLKRNDSGFLAEIGTEEIQIIANFMKVEWLNRCVMTWENVKPMYTERDFSQANLLEFEKTKAEKAESNYYRSIKGKPFDFSRLASND